MSAGTQHQTVWRGMMPLAAQLIEELEVLRSVARKTHAHPVGSADDATFTDAQFQALARCADAIARATDLSLDLTWAGPGSGPTLDFRLTGPQCLCTVEAVPACDWCESSRLMHLGMARACDSLIEFVESWPGPLHHSGIRMSCEDEVYLTFASVRSLAGESS